MDNNPTSPSFHDDSSHIGTIDEHGSYHDVPVNPLPAGNQMVGWSVQNTPTTTTPSPTKSRSIRPMHIRLSVRIHHISFLHPGLDAGGSTLTTNRGKSKSWLPKKSEGPAGAPGPMAFGARRGSWKNPSKGRRVHKKSSSVDEVSKHYVDEEPSSGIDATEVAEIISSEAFRLSRDGIIQQHHALTKEDTVQQSLRASTVSPRGTSPRIDNETSRYYKECANRPKGYRRLVVSSMIPNEDGRIPDPPVVKRGSMKSRGMEDADSGHQGRNGKEEGDVFDRVEYRYLGPPNTGPAFFHLLRLHGAASFGRFLPELACSVPKHSIAFELRKRKSSTLRSTQSSSTQPIVIEAPHVIWGDARDKTLARIAREGCPLIDAREFEYVSNGNLKDAQLSETLMVCGATVWVQNATDTDRSTASTLKKKEAMVKAEYYGGKLADGMKDGAKAVGKGVVKAGKILSPSSHHRDKDKSGDDGSVAASVASRHSHGVASVNPTTPDGAVAEGEEHGEEKKKKKKVGFHGIGAKLRRDKKKKKKKIGDDASVGSAQSGLDDASIVSLASESMDTQPGVIPQQRGVTSEQLTVHTPTTPIPEESDNQSIHSTQEYKIVKSQPYVLILDDIINIQIVSFPDKDVLAKFPISVASVMAQRNVEDRINDPLKPSELTATLIQEPSAPKLQWGVELKITVRAVEVKPTLPRVIMPSMHESPIDSIHTEMKHMRDALVEMGKTKEEIDAAVKEKEREVSEREYELNQAIVAAGLGRGEYGGANPDEIQKQQMFYDEREHKSIERKMKRRGRLSVSQKNLLRDARFDPAAMGTSNIYNDEQKILKLLSTHFPGVDEDSIATPKHNNSQRSKSKDIRASISLAIAESMDHNLGEYLDAPTVELVKKSLMEQSHLGHSHDGTPMTAEEVKEWCYDVASKLTLSSSPRGPQYGRSISQIQEVIVSSAGGTMPHVDLDEKEHKEVPPDAIDEVNGWCMTVLAKLDSCAEELDDHEDDESTQFSVHDELLDSEKDGEDAELPSFSESRSDIISSDGGEFKLSLPQLAAKNRTEADDDSSSIHSDDSVWKNATARHQSVLESSGNLQRVLGASTLSTFEDAIPNRESAPSRAAGPLLKSMRESHFQVHRSFVLEDNGNNVRSGSPRLMPEEDDGSDLKDYVGMKHVMAFFVVVSVVVMFVKYKV